MSAPDRSIAVNWERMVLLNVPGNIVTGDGKIMIPLNAPDRNPAGNVGILQAMMILLNVPDCFPTGNKVRMTSLKVIDHFVSRKGGKTIIFDVSVTFLTQKGNAVIFLQILEVHDVQTETLVRRSGFEVYAWKWCEKMI